MSAIDKRLYYLMLSPALGQEFANTVGFSTPSEEVREAETYEVIARWALMTSMGLLEEVLEASDWFCELHDMGEIETDDEDSFHRILVSHGVSLINKLLDSEKIILVMEEEDGMYDD